MQLPALRVEQMFARHEFTSRFNPTGSDVQGIDLKTLWSLAPPATHGWYESLTLGYTRARATPFGARPPR